MTAATMTNEDWASYVQRITAGLPREQIAAAAGIHVTGVYRWLRDQNKPRAEKVVAFARSLNQSPLEALIAAGYLAAEEVGGAVEIVRSSSQMSDQELLDEVAQRLAERHSADGRPDLLGPIPSFGDGAQGARKRSSG